MKEKLKGLFTSKSEEWETPSHLFEELNKEFDFDFDLAANESNSKCESFRTKETNDFSLFSENNPPLTCWMNPPYGKNIKRFVQWAWDLSNKNCIVCLLPARTDTRWWSIFWDRENNCPKPNCEIRFLPYAKHHKSRLKFEFMGKPVLDKNGKEQTAPFPSVIVIMGKSNDRKTELNIQ